MWSKLIDVTGKRFGRWTVLALHPERTRRQATWLCRCDCGTERIVCGAALRNGHSASCGDCIRRGPQTIDLVGKRFGRWTVLAMHPERRHYTHAVRVVWLCRCDCG